MKDFMTGKFYTKGFFTEVNSWARLCLKKMTKPKECGFLTKISKEK